MKLGNGGPSWSILYNSGPRASFFRGRWFSLYAPGDLDGDGMDDVWELDHGLNPLNSADASYTNSASGLTWLQEYQQTFGRRVLHNEAISHEVTLYNFGKDLPGSRYEAISHEIGLYNFGKDLPGVRYEAISPEVTIYLGERAPLPYQHEAISSEVSLYNFGVDLPGVRYEAISQEVSIYKGERAPQPNQHEAISLEVSLYNFGVDLPGVRYEAISHEVSIYNNN